MAAALPDETSPAGWRSLLRNRSYLALWLGQMIGQAGDPFRQMALQVFVYEATGSAAAIGVLATLQMLPSLLLGPVAGVLVDRWDRRMIMVVSQVVRSLLVATLVLLPVLPLVYGVAIVAAAIGLFYLPARNALLPRLVGREQLLAANSFSMTTGTLLMMLAPALASLVIGWRGTGAAFGVNSACFAGAALAALAIRVPKARGPAPDRESSLGRSFRGEIREGLVYVRRSPLVRGLIVIFGVQNLGFAAMPVVQIVYVDRVLGLPPSALGYLMSFFAVGMLVGGGALAGFGKRVSQTRVVTLASTGFGALFLLLATTDRLPVVFAIVVGMGVCEAALAVAVPTLLQQHVPDELRGRVFSVQNVVMTALSVVGMGLAGVLAEVLPVQTVLTVGGLISVAGGLLGFWVFAEGRVAPPAPTAES